MSPILRCEVPGGINKKSPVLEHVFSLVGQCGALAGELKGDFVLTKSPVIDSLRVRAMGGFDHQVGVFHQLEMLAAGAAFFDFIEHRGWLQQVHCFRHGALFYRIGLRDLDRIARVNYEPGGWAVAVIFVGDIGRHDENVAFRQFEVAFGCPGHAFVLNLDLRFIKPRRSVSIRALRRAAMHQLDAHVIVDKDRDLFGVAVAGKIFCQQIKRRNQLAGPLKCCLCSR